jgi:hypothetical protein
LFSTIVVDKQMRRGALRQLRCGICKIGAILSKPWPQAGAFCFLERGMSICRDCPHFDFAVAVTPDGQRGPRVAMDCDLGMSMAGVRDACELKPVRVDTGERRRKTDMGGDAS